MSDASSLDASARTAPRGSAGEVLLAFLKLGLTSFGGPVAHLGYFREAFVVRRQWLTEAAYADLVALGQFLPGPASSQVGMALGLMRAGLPGMAAAWLGFTLPSALLMLAFAYGVESVSALTGAGWLAGLKAAAAAVVAHAVLGMAGTLCPDRARRTIALAAAAAAAVLPGAIGQIAVLLAGAFIGLAVLRLPPREAGEPLQIAVPRPAAILSLVLFALALVGLPLLAQATGDGALRLADALYRAGALVFGGGHVVLPLIEAELVHPGGLTREAFLAGYGAAQAVPGPLFTFAAYVGAMMPTAPNGAAGAAVALLAIFLPSALLVYGALPFWARIAADKRAQDALGGVNAAVVGLLGAAFWDPVASAGVTSARAFAIALVAYLALALWRAPPWAVVVGAAVMGAAAL